MIAFPHHVCRRWLTDSALIHCDYSAFYPSWHAHTA